MPHLLYLGKLGKSETSLNVKLFVKLVMMRQERTNSNLVLLKQGPIQTCRKSEYSGYDEGEKVTQDEL